MITEGVMVFAAVEHGTYVVYTVVRVCVTTCVEVDVVDTLGFEFVTVGMLELDPPTVPEGAYEPFPDDAKPEIEE